MRICYFIPGPISRGPHRHGELGRRREFLAGRAFAGTQVEVREAESGPASIESAAEEQMAVPGLLEALPGLEEEGFDAVIVGCFGDPGLSPARELVEIPVIGPAQASAHLAAQLGQRFAILTVVEEVIPTLRRLVHGYGLDPIMADLRSVDVPVLELAHRREETLEALVVEGKAALEAGADVLILGCMTMGFLDVAAELVGLLDVPVVNPVLAALKSAEAQVSLGLAASRRAYPTSRKAAAEVVPKAAATG